MATLAVVWRDAPTWLRVATYWTPAAMTLPHLTVAPNGATLTLVAATVAAAWATDKEATR